MRAAASRSSRLVYDSSLPWRIVAAPRPDAGHAASTAAIPRGLLMRVLAVAQIADLLEREIEPIGEPTSAGVRSPVAVRSKRSPSSVIVSQRRGDRGVVGGRVRERLAHQLEPERQARRPRRAPRAGAGSRPDRRRPARRGSSWPRRAPATGRRCRSPRPARRTASSGFAAAFDERIQVDDDESTRPMPWRASAARSSGRSRRARMPP